MFDTHYIQIVSFIIGLFGFTFISIVSPMRQFNVVSSLKRWVCNISLTGTNTLILSFLWGGTIYQFAQTHYSSSDGVIYLSLTNSLVNTLLSIVIFDLIIYWQHRLMHIHPILWAFHQVHHSDIQLDTTTALRFHCIEILFSLLIKISAIYTLNLQPLGCLVAMISLNFFAMFNHSNIKISTFLEKLLHNIFVTPNMHQVHHNRHGNFTDSNYGFCLSIWDKLFGSYQVTSAIDLTSNNTIGLDTFREPQQQKFTQLLLQPFQTHQKKKKPN